LVTFYAHPSTDNKGGRATKNTMGRWLHTNFIIPKQVHIIRMKLK
jgi:hypothetical protein